MARVVYEASPVHYAVQGDRRGPPPPGRQRRRHAGSARPRPAPGVRARPRGRVPGQVVHLRARQADAPALPRGQRLRPLWLRPVPEAPAPPATRPLTPPPPSRPRGVARGLPRSSTCPPGPRPVV